MSRTTSPSHRDLEGSALGVLLGSGAAIAGSFGVRLIAARALAADDVGALLLAVAAASLAGGLAGLGLRSATARRVAALLAEGRPATAARAARTALLLAATTGALAAVLVPLLPLAGLGELARLPPALLLAVAPACFGLPLGIATWGISQGHHDTRGRALLRDGLGSLLRLAGVAAAAFVAGDAWLFALAWGLGSFAGEAAFVIYGVSQRWLRRPSPGFDRPLLAALPPFTGSTWLSQLGTWLDVLLLGAVAPLPVVAAYGLAQSLGRVLGQIHDSAAHRYLPLATAAVTAGDAASLARHYGEARRVALGYLWVALAPCLLCPEPLVRAVFGAGYEAAALPLAILAAGWLVRGLAGYAEETLHARGRAGTVFLLVAISTAVTAGLLFLLAPVAGAAGAAAATAAGQLTRGLGARVFVGPLELGRDALRHRLVPLLPAAAVGLAFLLPADPPPFAPGAIGLAALATRLWDRRLRG